MKYTYKIVFALAGFFAQKHGLDAFALRHKLYSAFRVLLERERAKAYRKHDNRRGAYLAREIVLLIRALNDADSEVA